MDAGIGHASGLSRLHIVNIGPYTQQSFRSMTEALPGGDDAATSITLTTVGADVKAEKRTREGDTDAVGDSHLDDSALQRRKKARRAAQDRELISPPSDAPKGVNDPTEDLQNTKTESRSQTVGVATSPNANESAAAETTRRSLRQRTSSRKRAEDGRTNGELSTTNGHTPMEATRPKRVIKKQPIPKEPIRVVSANKPGLDIQASSCSATHWRGAPTCAPCIRHRSLPCRFKSVRAYSQDASKHQYKVVFVSDSPSDEIPINDEPSALRSTDAWKRLPISMQYNLRFLRGPFLETVERDLKHLSAADEKAAGEDGSLAYCIKQAEPYTRQVCDICEQGIYSVCVAAFHWCCKEWEAAWAKSLLPLFGPAGILPLHGVWA